MIPNNLTLESWKVTNDNVSNEYGSIFFSEELKQLFLDIYCFQTHFQALICFLAKIVRIIANFGLELQKYSKKLFHFSKSEIVGRRD